MRRVLIVETQLQPYRRRFFQELARALAPSQIQLQIAYSGDGELAGLGIEIASRSLFGGRLVIQNAWAAARGADLVIVDQSNRLAFNALLLAVGKPRMAYWGHGYNHQAARFGVSEWLKRKLLRRADWWFAYTPGVSRYLVEHGVAAETISTVYNTIDVAEFAAAVDRASPAATRRELAIDATARVAIYCGALVRAKQLAFLADAAAEIRRLVPTFELVVVGDGPERAMLEAIARYRPFIHVVGPALGVERARYFALAEACLIPARVGLVIADAFAAGLPLLTTAAPGHGPELEYLSTDTGLVAPHDVDAYAAAVADVLRDPQRLAAMRAAARARGLELPLAKMVDHFAAGIRRCLEQP